MRNETEALVGIAELGLAYAGFTGVVLALSGGRTAADRQRLALLLSTSLPVVVLALVPVGLSCSEIKATTKWQIASGLNCAYGVIWSVWYVLYRMSFLDEPVVVERPWLDYTLGPVGVLGHGIERCLLWVHLGDYLAGVQFVDIVFVRPGERDRD